MALEFDPGDFLIFQLEAGYGLLRVLGSEGEDGDKVWHLAAYRDLFMDVDSAERAINSNDLNVELPHVAITNRAFESTQVARVASAPLDPTLSETIEQWRSEPEHQVHDRSIRLLLGLR
jgi:hypothetical protein